MLKYCDYIFVLRPVLWMPVWTMAILGAQQQYNYHFNTAAKIPQLWLLLTSTAFLFGAVYLLNQMYDIESDRVNRKLFFLADQLISPLSAALEVVFLNSLAIAVAFFVSSATGWFFVVVVLLGYLYSVPPFRLKDRPWLGLLANMLAHGSIVFLIGWTFTGPIEKIAWLKSIPYFSAVGGLYLNTTIPDHQGDERAGKITLAVKWGVRKTQALAFMLVALSAILAHLFSDAPLLISALVVTPFFLMASLQGSIRWTVISTKISLLLLSGFACLFYPAYAGLLIAGFFGTRLYYKKRFGLTYPNLSPTA